MKARPQTSAIELYHHEFFSESQATDFRYRALPHKTPSGDRSGGAHPLPPWSPGADLGVAEWTSGAVFWRPFAVLKIRSKAFCEADRVGGVVHGRHKMGVTVGKSGFWTQWRMFGVRWATLATHDESRKLRF